MRLGLISNILGKGSFYTIVFSALAHFTYVALAGVLILAGLGLPIPEDIPLVLSGYMCNKDYSPINDLTHQVDVDGDGIKEDVPRHIPHLYLMIVAGLCGVLIGDSIVFSIGRHGIEGKGFVARHLRKVMHTKRREKVERHFAKHGNLTVFAGRFMPGFRSIVFAFAGLSKMSFPRFLLIDGVAAFISVPTFIFLGYYFADRISGVMGWIDRIKHILGPILLAALILAAFFYYRRRKQRVAVEVVEFPVDALHTHGDFGTSEPNPGSNKPHDSQAAFANQAKGRAS